MILKRGVLMFSKEQYSSLEDREGIDVVIFLHNDGQPNRETILSQHIDKGLGLVPKYKDVLKEVQL